MQEKLLNVVILTVATNGARLNDSYYLRIKKDKHEYRIKTS